VDDAPWTLPGNVAVAVSPRASYARARVGDDFYVLVSDRVEAVLGEGAESSRQFSGEQLVARYGGYEGPIFAASDREPGVLQILADEFVTTEDGTGMVHLAPAFGEDDYRVRRRRDLPRRRSAHAVQPGQAGRHLRRASAQPRRRALHRALVKDQTLTRELIGT